MHTAVAAHQNVGIPAVIMRIGLLPAGIHHANNASAGDTHVANSLSPFPGCFVIAATHINQRQIIIDSVCPNNTLAVVIMSENRRIQETVAAVIVLLHPLRLPYHSTFLNAEFNITSKVDVGGNIAPAVPVLRIAGQNYHASSLSRHIVDSRLNCIGVICKCVTLCPELRIGHLDREIRHLKAVHLIKIRIIVYGKMPADLPVSDPGKEKRG